MSAAKVCVAIYELFQPGGTRAKNSTWWDESKCKTSSPGPGQLPRQTKTFQLDQHLSGFLVSGLQSGFVGSKQLEMLFLGRSLNLHLLECRMREIKGLQQRLVDGDQLLHLGLQARHLLLPFLLLLLLLLLGKLPVQEGEEAFADAVDRLHDRSHYLRLGIVLGSNLS